MDGTPVMSANPLRARFWGTVFGVVVWVAIAAGAAVLDAAGAPRRVVAAFALLAVVGLVVLGVRFTMRR
jgi:hypothetical protein